MVMKAPVVPVGGQRGRSLEASHGDRDVAVSTQNYSVTGAGWRLSAISTAVSRSLKDSCTKGSERCTELTASSLVPASLHARILRSNGTMPASTIHWRPARMTSGPIEDAVNSSPIGPDTGRKGEWRRTGRTSSCGSTSPMNPSPLPATWSLPYKF